MEPEGRKSVGSVKEGAMRRSGPRLKLLSQKQHHRQVVVKKLQATTRYKQRAARKQQFTTTPARAGC